MKRFISIFYMSFMLVLAPFSFVIGSAILIRVITKRPIYYHAKTITNIGQKNNILDCDKLDFFTSLGTSTYAKIKAGAYLFKTSDISNCSHYNVYYNLPESYFVEIVGEVNSMITKVRYKNQIGYVSNGSIMVVDFIPNTPYLGGVTFDILDSAGTQLRSSPTASDNDNIKILLPSGVKNIEYIASINGVVPVGGSSNVWFYCFYSPQDDPTSVYEGYVYSERTINLSSITPSEEGKNELSKTDNIEEEQELSINAVVKTILIIFICLPIVLVFVLLVLQNKRKNVEDFSVEDVVDESVLKQEKLDRNYQKEKHSKQNTNRLKKVDDLSNISLSKKVGFQKQYIQVDDDNKDLPEFPVYEIVDDEDLL